jgi:hypothetical protein
MKSCHAFLVACTLILSPISTVHAQVATPDGAFAVMKSKYRADVKAIHAARDAACAVVKKTYLTALNETEAKVSAAGNISGLKAVVEEKNALTNGGNLTSQPSADLSRDLLNARNTYFRETARLRESTAPRVKEIQSEYLRNLASVEMKARSMKNQPLVDKVVAEKLELAGQTVTEVKDAVNPTTTSQLERWLTNGKHKWYWKSAENEKGGSAIEFLRNGTMTLGNQSRWEIVDLLTLKLPHQGRIATLKFNESYTKFTVEGWVSGRRYGELVK